MDTKSKVINFLKDFRLLWNRNTIIIILVNVLYSYGNYMKNGFRSLMAANEVGASTAAIGLAGTVFLLFGLFSRVPSGAICDFFRKKLKFILALSFLLKLLCWAGFLLVKNERMLYVVYALDGILYAFHGTALPAIVAISVNRKAIGRAYAIMIGLTDIITASARPAGISLYQLGGLQSAVFCTCVLMICCAALTAFVDGEELQKVKVAIVSIGKSPVAHIKKFPKTLLLLALVANMPAVIFAGENNFFPLYAEELGFSYLTATAMGGSIYGFLSCFIGFLCDIVNPSVLIIIGLMGQALAPFMWAGAGSEWILNAGILMFYSTRYYGTAIRIQGMKLVENDSQGSFQAVFMACFDFFSIVSTITVGYVVYYLGYRITWILLGVWGVIAAASYILYLFKSKE